jgi:hypothetical protein
MNEKTMMSFQLSVGDLLGLDRARTREAGDLDEPIVSGSHFIKALLFAKLREHQVTFG